VVRDVAAPLTLLAVVIALDVWVYVDAARRQGGDREVRATVAGLTIDRSLAWLVWCLVLFVLAFPLYLVARAHADDGS
jgi:hypothetical protein